MNRLITINAGSSSLKAAVYQVSEAQVSNEVEKFTASTGDQSSQAELLKRLRRSIEGHVPIAIAHRVVHGGPKYHEVTQLTDNVKHDLHEFAAFDADHAPFALELMDLCSRTFPGVEQFACFDTAFFHDLPTVAQLLPLPRKYLDEGLRRYGFHGLSYTYLRQAFQKLAGQTAVDGRVIYAHLGGGASLAATLAGKPIDTTMSFTTASGLVMSSRSGDLDPGISEYLYRRHNVSPEAFSQLVNAESGLLGVSGLSADMKTLLEHETSNRRAAEAIALFCYRVVQAVGALTTSIGGLDSLIFSGGIGEQSAPLRKRICDRLAFLGVTLDDARNQRHERLISSPSSRVGVHVLPTDEALVMATQVMEKLNKHGA
jgi:acetate kinase